VMWCTGEAGRVTQPSGDVGMCNVVCDDVMCNVMCNVMC